MDQGFEAAYHQIEGAHWWSLSRRAIIMGLLDDAGIGVDARVLDVGCASGRLIRQLAARGHKDVVGIDIAEEAIRYCARSGLENVQVMDAASPSFPEASFDVLVASDVLEHIEADRSALAAWWRLLRPGGWLFCFVPAFRSLWSTHDVHNQHARRYERDELKEKVLEAGFELVRLSAWNLSLFYPAMVVRAIDRITSRKKTPEPELAVPSGLVNWALVQTLRVENALLRRRDFRLGVSFFAVARRPG